jgi:hypothetical protein
MISTDARANPNPRFDVAEREAPDIGSVAACCDATAPCVRGSEWLIAIDESRESNRHSAFPIGRGTVPLGSPCRPME